jgi:hypothetical protein
MSPIVIKYYTLVSFNFIYMLVTILDTIFVLIYVSLIAIRFSLINQFISSNLLSSHSSGGREETAKKGERLRERRQRIT